MHTYKRKMSFQRTYALHWSNHNFAFKPCGWRILHFCHDVDPLVLVPYVNVFVTGKHYYYATNH